MPMPMPPMPPMSGGPAMGMDRLLFGLESPLAGDFIGISANLNNFNVALDPGRLP